MMYNPPHPGSILREYLGDVSVTSAAGDLGRNARVALSHSERKRGHLGRNGFTPLGSARNVGRALDRNAGEVRPVAGLAETPPPNRPLGSSLKAQSARFIAYSRLHRIVYGQRQYAMNRAL